MVTLQRDTRRHLCPACGSDLRRVPRTAEERHLAQTQPLRRYRCPQPGCHWEGLLPRQHVHKRSARRRAGAALPVAMQATTASTPAARMRWTAVATLMIAGLFGGALAAGLLRGLAGSPAAITPLPGVHHEGDAISSAHPLLQAPPSGGPQVVPLTLKQGCAWGQPGRSPYQGDVEQALSAARLPAEVVQRIALKVRSGRPDDRLTVSTAAIRARRDAREFDPRNVALTYGHTLCVNSRVNFKPGHTEAASLYEATDQQGQLHSVMVPDVCGNVSVLGVRMDGGRAQVLPVLAYPGGESVPVLHTAWVDEDAAARQRQVPVPGTLAHALLALAAMATVGRWQGKGR